MTPRIISIIISYVVFNHYTIYERLAISFSLDLAVQHEIIAHWKNLWRSYTIYWKNPALLLKKFIFAVLCNRQTYRLLKLPWQSSWITYHPCYRQRKYFYLHFSLDLFRRRIPPQKTNMWMRGSGASLWMASFFSMSVCFAKWNPQSAH